MRHLIFLAMLLAATNVFANDSSFGGEGANPMPLRNEHIEMVGEHVILRASDNAWNVTCEFTFKNTTAKKQSLQIGFPFPANEGESDVSTPAGVKYPKTGDPLVWKFKSWVRGKPVKVKRKTFGENPALPQLAYRVVFLWDVTFEPNETVVIKNTYVNGLSGDSMGGLWASYVLKTGALWKGGKIGRSKLEVHAPPQMLLPPAEFRAGDNPFGRIKPAGAKVQRHAKGTTITWDLPNFAPTEDLHVQYLSPWAVPQFVKTSWTPAELTKMSKAQLRMARNQISATHGYVFKSADLRKHFAAQWWYRPNAKWSLDELEKSERDMIGEIRQHEAKAK